MELRGWLGLLALGLLLAAGLSSASTSIGGFLGCKFSDAVCLEDEACIDDHLFGSCQSRGRRDYFQYFMDSASLQALEAEIYRLLRAGFSWTDLYTQCVLGNILLAYRRGSDTYDSGWCDRPEVPASDTLDSQALAALERYFEEYYDAIQEEDVTPFESNDVIDVNSPFDDATASDKFKKDEVVSVHKYFAPKRVSDADPRDLGENLDALLGQLAPDDVDALRIYLQGMDDEQSSMADEDMLPANDVTSPDLGYAFNEEDSLPPPDAPYDGEEDSQSLPAGASSLLGAEGPSPGFAGDEDVSMETDGFMSPPEAKLLDDLLQDKVDVQTLDDEQISRMLQVVEGALLNAETENTNTDVKRQPTKRRYHVAIKKEQMNSDVLQNPGGQAEVHVRVAPVPDKRAPYRGEEGQEIPDGLDHNFDKPTHIHEPSRPKLELVNTNYGYIIVKPPTNDVDEANNLVAEIERSVGLHAGDVQVQSVREGDIGFHVNQNALGLNASIIANIAVLKSVELQNKTGLSVITAGFGKETTVSVEEATRYNGPKYFVITFVLCGVIAGCVLAVVALYVVRRHSRSKQKLMALSQQPDGLEASKDYQDLCRQRMQSKSSEKPEPINVAARVGSVSATEGQAAVHSPSSRSSTSSWSEEPVTSNMDISTGHIVLSYMEDHLKNRDRLDQEWDGLCAYDAEPNSIAAAMDPSNMRKTRYSDVLPYDHSRVALNVTTNVSGSDYINASTITDHDPRNPAYIASQGPLPHTVADFWQMVWEQGSVVIVMLTKLTENGVAMCHRYWPEEGSDLYHIYEVHLVSEHIWCDDYLVRSFYLKNLQTNETRTVTQFHFLSWADLGIPASVKALLDFRRKVNKSYRGRSCPIVVHCSDGSGRTGTYTLIDMVLNRMSKGAKEIDIAATLEHIRDQRMNMVKTKEQFEFALASVAEEVHAILKALPQ